MPTTFGPNDPRRPAGSWTPELAASLREPAPDPSLVEAVARALFGPDHAWAWPELEERYRQRYRDDAQAAIAAVRAWDLVRQPYAEYGTCDQGHRHARLVWPEEVPAGAIWCSIELIERLLVSNFDPPAELKAVIVDGVPIPANPGGTE